MSFNRANRANLLTLKSEINTDPEALGYSAVDTKGKALILNDASLGENLDPATISATDLQAAVVATEYGSLSAIQRELWMALLQSTTAGGVQATNTNIRSQITTIWGAGTTTRSNLAALQTRNASRAEILFGEGVSITPQAVGRALNQD